MRRIIITATLLLSFLCTGCTKMIFDGLDPEAISPVETTEDGLDSKLICDTIRDYFVKTILENNGWKPKTVNMDYFFNLPKIDEEIGSVTAIMINSEEQLGEVPPYSIDLGPNSIELGPTIEMPHIDFEHYTLIVGVLYDDGTIGVTDSRVKKIPGGIHLYLKKSRTGSLATTIFHNFAYLYPKLPGDNIKVTCVEP